MNNKKVFEMRWVGVGGGGVAERPINSESIIAD
jgi:hypothetical protein